LLFSLLRRYWGRVSVWKRVRKVYGLLRFALFALVMFSFHSCSSCTCNGWGMKNSSVSFHGGVGRRFDFAPLCYCGEKAITRIARIAKNKGRKFWGCPKFKVCDMEMNLVLFFGGCCFCILVFKNLILQLGVFFCFVGQGESEEVVGFQALTHFPDPIPNYII